MTDNLVTKDDLRDTRDQLAASLREGFDDIRALQAVTNGRIRELERVTGIHDGEIKVIKSTLVQKQMRRGEDTQAISQRDVTIVGATLGVGWAVLKVLAWLFPITKILAP